jgi:hypothetical protein
MGRFDALDELVRQIGEADWKRREVLRDELTALARTFPDPLVVIERLEDGKRAIANLEARWEVDEVIEAITPPPAPPPEPEKPAAPKKLSSADLQLAYDDAQRGIRVHKSKVGDRWFLTQIDPRTYQPQTFELRPEEVSQLKIQLKGSPFWVPGMGS